MEKNKPFDINDLSGHLFWDVDRKNLTIDKHFRFIVQRVLQYGLLSDWKLLCNSFGIEKIAEESKEIRDLDDKSMYFIAHISGTNIHDFKCYTTRQSIPKHWHF